jgi:hypothetical protein
MNIVTKNIAEACRILKPFTTSKLEEGMAKEPTFACVYFDGKVAHATNGHIYAKTACDSEGFVGYLPATVTYKLEGMVIGGCTPQAGGVVRGGKFTHTFTFKEFITSEECETLSIKSGFSTFLRRDWEKFIDRVFGFDGERLVTLGIEALKVPCEIEEGGNDEVVEVLSSHIIRESEPSIEEPCSCFFSIPYVKKIFTAGKVKTITLKLQDRPDRLGAGFIAGKVSGVLMPIRATKKCLKALEELRVDKVSDTVVKAIVDDVVANGYTSLKEEVKEVVAEKGVMVIDPSAYHKSEVEYNPNQKYRYILHCNECHKNESQIATFNQINELRALIECDRESCECGSCDLEVRPMPRKRTSN